MVERESGQGRGEWKEHEIESGSPIEFAFLVDLDNDGKAREVLPQFGDAKMPLAWYEARQGRVREARGQLQAATGTASARAT